MIKRFLKFLKLGNSKNVDDEYMSAPKAKIYNLFSKNLYADDYFEKLGSWLFYNYFNNNDSLVEKKYKVAVLSLICHVRHIYLGKMPLIDDMIQDFSKELIDNKETIVNLYDTFKKDENQGSIFRYISSMQKPLIPVIDLINQVLDEDKYNPEKLIIAKDIYQQFSYLCLLAHTIFDSKDSNNYKIFLRFQDSKFTEDEMVLFRNFVKKVKESEYNNGHFVRLDVDYWKPFILGENNSDNLEVFKQLYLNDEHTSSGSFYGGLHRMYDRESRLEEKKYLISLIAKRIEYLDFHKDLEDCNPQNQESTNKIKRPKL